MKYAVMLFALSSGVGMSADNFGKIDDVLKKLERKLEGDRQIETLNAERKRKPADRKLKFKPNKIEQVPRLDAELKTLDAEIAVLEGRTEELSAEVHSLRQKILENAQLDNYVQIFANVQKPEAHKISELRVKIDGSEIYRLNESEGLWNPDGMIPLYEGPMSVGEHKVEFSAKIRGTENGSTPVNAYTYHIIDESYQLAVGDKGFKGFWSIVIGPNTDGKPVAMLKDEGKAK